MFNQWLDAHGPQFLVEASMVCELVLCSFIPFSVIPSSNTVMVSSGAPELVRRQHKGAYLGFEVAIISFLAFTND